MLFSFFYKWRRHTNSYIHESGQVAEGVHTLSALPDENTSDLKYDPAVENDLSYTDALWDAYLRLHMQAEYGGIEPPAGVLAKVLRVIRQNVAGNITPAHLRPSVLTNLLVKLRSALGGQIAGRLLPGGVALAIALGLSLPATSQLVDSKHSTLAAPMWSASPSPTLRFPPAAAQQEQATATALDPGNRSAPSGTYPPADDGSMDGAYDPYDLHTPPKKPGDVYRLHNENQKSGPQ